MGRDVFRQWRFWQWYFLSGATSHRFIISSRNNGPLVYLRPSIRLYEITITKGAFAAWFASIYRIRRMIRVYLSNFSFISILLCVCLSNVQRIDSTFGVFHNFPERMAQLSDDLECVLLFRREAYQIRQSKWHCRPVPEFSWITGLTSRWLGEQWREGPEDVTKEVMSTRKSTRPGLWMLRVISW